MEPKILLVADYCVIWIYMDAVFVECQGPVLIIISKSQIKRSLRLATAILAELWRAEASVR